MSKSRARSPRVRRRRVGRPLKTKSRRLKTRRVKRTKRVVKRTRKRTRKVGGGK